MSWALSSFKTCSTSSDLKWFQCINWLLNISTDFFFTLWLGGIPYTNTKRTIIYTISPVSGLHSLIECGYSIGMGTLLIVCINEDAIHIARCKSNSSTHKLSFIFVYSLVYPCKKWMLWMPTSCKILILICNMPQEESEAYNNREHAIW